MRHPCLASLPLCFFIWACEDGDSQSWGGYCSYVMGIEPVCSDCSIIIDWGRSEHHLGIITSVGVLSTSRSAQETQEWYCSHDFLDTEAESAMRYPIAANQTQAVIAPLSDPVIVFLENSDGFDNGGPVTSKIADPGLSGGDDTIDNW